MHAMLATHVLDEIAKRWPELAGTAPPSREVVAQLAARAALPWQVATPRPGESYELAIAEGRIPTRDASWHDTFNVLAFVVFPRAKAALHARMGELLRARAPGAQRCREGDALTVLDESTLVLGGDADALVELAAARALPAEPMLAAIDALVHGDRIVVACFGHALLEHRALARPHLDAAALAVLVDPRDGDAAIDLGVARAIERHDLTTRSFSPGLPWPHPRVDAWLARGARVMLG